MVKHLLEMCEAAARMELRRLLRQTNRTARTGKVCVTAGTALAHLVYAEDLQYSEIEAFWR